MLMPRAGNLAVEHVKNKRCRRQRGRREKMKRQLRAHVEHGEQHAADAARGIAEREKVGEMEVAQHREMAGWSGLHGCFRVCCDAELLLPFGRPSLFSWVPLTRQFAALEGVGGIPCEVRVLSNSRGKSAFGVYRAGANSY